MRTVFLMAAFSVGCVLLLPRPARSLDDCVECPCKEMKAWVTADPKASFDPRPRGLRCPDPNNPKLTIPLPHAPNTELHPYVAAVPDPGVGTPQGVSYPLYIYKQPPVYECNVKAGTKADRLVNVTFANNADWDDFIPSDILAVTWRKCVVEK